MDARDFTVRRERLSAEMRARGLDAYAVSTEENIWYLTGLVYRPEERPFVIVQRNDGGATLVVPELERRHLIGAGFDGAVEPYWEFPSLPGRRWQDALARALSGCVSVGYEGKAKASLADAIGSAAPGARAVDLVEELRLRKDTVELEGIRRAAIAASEAMASLLSSVYAGASVLESFLVSKATQTRLIKEGSYSPLLTQLLTVAWPAPRSSMPHSVPGVSERFGAGPCVAMCYFRVSGYAAECERTFFLEAPGRRERELFEAMMEARRRGLAAVRPGAPCSSVDAAANGWLLERGLGGLLLHRTGHGIGLGNHEEPWLAEGDDRPLEPGMVVSVEPGLYAEGVGGFRHSDTVLVTEDGYELLTRAPTDIDSLTLRGAGPLRRLRGALVRAALGLRPDRS